MNEDSYSYNGSVCVGTRFMLVGILYVGPQFDVNGNISFSHLPTVKTSIPTNLGLVIRSDELKRFEGLFGFLIKLNDDTK